MTPEELEEDTRALLRLQGWSVSTERILGHKRIDSLAERSDDFGRTQRVAVECKSSSAPMTQADVAHVLASYQPLLDSNLVDTVLLVTLKPLAHSAVTFVEGTRSLRHLTHDALLRGLIDFSSYLRGLASVVSNTNASGVYVPQLFAEGEGTLESHLLEWVLTNDEQPVAILGGYGLGKTTLARRLASTLALRALQEPGTRIPVLLSLADIATDQTLEGLLGRQFTSQSLCQNYNFPLFAALNRRGRFVLLLDGFDEMKRAMSWESLLYNLEQLNQLVVPWSKVILLGRPSAFLSEDEEKEALHGVRRTSRREATIPGWPDYRVVHIRPFSRQQILDVCHQFKETLPDDRGVGNRHRHAVGSFVATLDGNDGKHLHDLASRPVQLRMLLELLPDYTGELTQLTVTVLYEEFVHLLFRREMAKPSRAAFTVGERQQFVSALAYWLWINDDKSDGSTYVLPDSLFLQFNSKYPEIPPLDLRRDLLNGGVLERKGPNGFYFPHRSLQEYFVAVYLAGLVKDPDKFFRDCPDLTPEATGFFIESITREAAERLRRASLRRSDLSEAATKVLKSALVHYDLSISDVGPPTTPSKRKQPSTSSSAWQTIEDKEKRKLLRRLLVGGTITRRGGKIVSPTDPTASQKSRTRARQKKGATPKHRYNKQ